MVVGRGWAHPLTALLPAVCRVRHPWLVWFASQSGSWFNLNERHLPKFGQNYCKMSEQVMPCDQCYEKEEDGDGLKCETFFQTYPSKLCDEIWQSGAIPVFFMTWATRTAMMAADNARLQGQVDEAYTNVAAVENAMCAPCGNALLMNTQTYPAKKFYTDDVHPSSVQQYTDALVFYATLTDKSPIGLGDAGSNLARSYNLTLLQEYAWKSYTDYKKREQAKCTAEKCVRFYNAETGLLSGPPPTTMATTTTITFADVPRQFICDAPSSTSDAGEQSTVHITNSTVLDASVQASPNFEALHAKLAEECPGTWEPCYTTDKDGWDADSLHAKCDFKGPTLFVVRTLDAVFGGFVPVNLTRQGRSVSTGIPWLFRQSRVTSKFEVTPLISTQMRMLHDFDEISTSEVGRSEKNCLWLGRWEDFKITGSDCKNGKSTPAYNPCLHDNLFCEDVNRQYSETWLAGRKTWTPETIEVFYSSSLVYDPVAANPTQSRTFV